MKTLYSIILLLLVSILGYSQAPEAFNYQAVVRNASGDILTNSQIALQISILQDSESGSAVYVETFNPTTNDYGLIAIKLGKGIVQSGTFNAIDWGAYAYYAKIEVDPNNGTDYTHMGTSQLLAVPYALYSNSAANVFSGNYNDLSNTPTAVSAFSNDAGYLTSFTETDPIFGAHTANGIVAGDITNWNSAFGWGDHAVEGYLKSFTETDPVFGAHAVNGIATGDITNWNSAFGWGDHNAEGYITDGNTNWDNSYGFITNSSTINGLIRSTASGNSWITGGNVGIGTTNPGHRLHVHQESANAYIRLSNNSGTANNILEFYEGATQQASFLVRGSGIVSGPPNAMHIRTHVSGAPLTLGTSSGEHIRITDDGDVGIGITDPDAKLHVHGGSVQFDPWPSSDSYARFSTGSGMVQLYLHDGSVTSVAIRSGGTTYFNGGRVLVGTGTYNYATGVGDLYVQDRLEVDGWTYSVGYGTTSDVRWKKNIVPVDDALNKILRLNGVNFNWKTVEYPDQGFNEDKQIGFIAQEVEEVLPELVTADIHNYKAVSYDKITAVLVEAIKEQQQMIEELRQEIEKLKTQRLVVSNQ